MPCLREWSRSAVHLLGRLLVLILWSSLGWTTVVAQPPILARTATALLIGVLAWWYVLRGRAARSRRHATLRLRGPGGAGPWLVVTVPIWIAFNLAAIRVHVHWLGQPPADPDTLHALTRESAEWITFALFGILLAPLLEEIFFRGFVQRPLERRAGAVTGVIGSAALFAAYHFEPWRLGHLLAGGIVLGAFVRAARSLWAGVLLHSSANASLLLVQAVGGDVDATGPGSSPTGEHLLLASSLALLVVLHSEVRKAALPGAAPSSSGGGEPRLRARLRSGLSTVARL